MSAPVPDCCYIYPQRKYELRLSYANYYNQGSAVITHSLCVITNARIVDL